MFADVLRSKLAGVAELTAGQVEQMRQHYELLTRWNKVLNLTSIRTLQEAIERHYCESVFLSKHLPEGSWAVADIGSGAGFPGVPVAILRPECAVALIEAHQRKAVFLREATRGLGNVRVVPRRASEVGETFVWVISRAVRVADIATAVKKLGGNAGLLSGEYEVPSIAGYSWDAPLKLPWGARRFLWIGHRGCST